MINNPNTGFAVQAVYTDPVLTEYRDNPLIEALPPILNMEQIEELLHFYPSFDRSECELDAHIRFHCVQRLFSYFQPWEKNFDVEQRFSRVIRQGYIARNPVKPQYASDMQKIYRMIKEGNYEFKNSELSDPSASGFTIIGFSGVGKTKAIESVLKKIYPQIIIHSKYKEEDLNHYQIVWLKLDCPHDGSVKGLCANFFLEIDRLLGEKTYNKFASGRNTTTDTMIPRMAQIAKRHSLGVLVIDEIQHLSVAKSGGKEKMLNFFVNLVNTIGIPVILIGTTKAMSILQGEFRQARRGSGQQGDMIWENMPKDENWDLLIEGIWEYQWTKKKCPLTKELSEILYDKSQGIVDIAIKLFAMTQLRAIATGIEVITPNLIIKVADDNLKLVKPMLEALKSGNWDEIKKYEDIRPLDIEAFCQEQLKIIQLNQKIKQKEVKEKTNSDNLFEQTVLQLIEYKIEPELAKKAAKQAIERLGSNEDSITVFKEAFRFAVVSGIDREEKLKKKANIKKIEMANDDLRLIVDKGRKEKKSAYEALLAKGVIKNPVEEFIMIG